MEIDVVIEDPRGSTVRHHWDTETQRWIVKAHPRSIDPWPANYGYVPGTYTAADDDDLDVLVLSRDPIGTGAEVRVLPVGVLWRPDGDNKILGVLVGDPDFGSITRLAEVPDSEIRAIEDWFAAWSDVGEWGSGDAARQRIEQAREDARKLKRIGRE
jgi:inorganic pyrophosphatase